MTSTITKPSELRTRTGEELEMFLREKREELFKLRMQHHTGQLENVARMRYVRREIARALTLIDERKRSVEA